MRAATLFLLVLAACGGPADVPIPPREWEVTLTLGTDPVVPGQSFDVTVQRIWSRKLSPQAWDPRCLRPLELRLQEVVRHTDGERSLERYRYKAWLFSREPVRLPETVCLAFPRGGGAARESRIGGVELAVQPAVKSLGSGPIELPTYTLLPLPPTWLEWLLLGCTGALTGFLVGFLCCRLRRDRTAPAPPPDPRTLALDRLARLRHREEATEDDPVPFHAEVADLVRAWLTTGPGLCSPEMTTADLLAAPRIHRELAEGHRVLLGRVLGRCDLVKFARTPAAPAERGDLLTGAETLVREALVAPEEVAP